MIPLKNRLQLRKIKDFFSKSQKVRGRFFTFFYQVQKEQLSQVAVIAPKKQLPTAVSRNRIKRRVKAVVLPMIKEKPGLKMAIVVYSGINELSHAELKKEINKMISRLVD